MKKLIKTPKKYKKALKKFDAMVILNPRPGSTQVDELELLALLIKSYEDSYVSIPSPTAVEAIRFRMEQRGLKQKDLVPFMGSKSCVSEILSGKRPLTLTMARELHCELGIPADVLLQENEDNVPEEIETVHYPVRDMHKLGWFSNYADQPWSEVKNKGKNLLREFFSPFKKQEFVGYNRAGFKPDAQLDKYALNAWRCRILTLVEDLELPTYEKEHLSDEFIFSLAKLSQLEEGPKLAIKTLESRGIAVVITSHLPRTYLDGAAMLSPEGNPIIGLTLRHDRLDNFWFTLFHELGHVYLHLSKGGEPFYDDIESGDTSEKEKQANDFALDHLIPRNEWLELKEFTKAAQIRKGAKRLAIHPSIIAGRLRRESGDYRRHRTLVGQGQVRAALGCIDKWPI